MVEAVIFIGTAIIAVTQLVKILVPDKVDGAVTIGVAVAVGILVALIDKQIGVPDVTIAQGVMIALSAVGFHTTVTGR